MAELAWPELPYEAWKDTLATLHMVLQIVGKIRLGLSPVEPQWAHVTLYVTARGMTTGPMEYGPRILQIDVDLIDHQVSIASADGDTRRIALTSRPVAAFYKEFMAALAALHVRVRIRPIPDEVNHPIPFAEDKVHSAYDPEWSNRFFRVLGQVDQVLKEHRSRFLGRTTPVHFFWGTFDLALTRFSGRHVQVPDGAGIIARNSGNVEQICAGFWPGDEEHFPEAALYAYTFPRPDEIEHQRINPAAATWNANVGEFILPYQDVRNAASPREAILQFCESTYAAGARLRGWDPGLEVVRET